MNSLKALILILSLKPDFLINHKKVLLYTIEDCIYEQKEKDKVNFEAVHENITFCYDNHLAISGEHNFHNKKCE